MINLFHDVLFCFFNTTSGILPIAYPTIIMIFSFTDIFLKYCIWGFCFRLFLQFFIQLFEIINLKKNCIVIYILRTFSLCEFGFICIYFFYYVEIFRIFYLDHCSVYFNLIFFVINHLHSWYYLILFRLTSFCLCILIFLHLIMSWSPFIRALILPFFLI